MRKANDFTLKEAIEAFLEAYKLDNRVKEEQVKASWEAVVGKMVKNHTENMHVRNKKLFVKVDSAVLRDELSYARESIRDSLNKEVGMDVIVEVVFQ